MRALTRTRRQLVREKAAHIQRIHKTLEDANLKIGSVASDIMGLSGRAILHALTAGETDPERLADLTRSRLKAARAHWWSPCGAPSGAGGETGGSQPPCAPSSLA